MMATFGDNLRAERNRKGLSQQDLATRLSTSRITVIRWENGSRAPNLRQIESICSVLELPVAALIDDAAPSPSSSGNGAAMNDRSPLIHEPQSKRGRQDADPVQDMDASVRSEK